MEVIANIEKNSHGITERGRHHIRAWLRPVGTLQPVFSRLRHAGSGYVRDVRGPRAEHLHDVCFGDVDTFLRHAVFDAGTQDVVKPEALMCQCVRHLCVLTAVTFTILLPQQQWQDGLFLLQQ